MGWAKSMPFEELKRNALMLAKAARILDLPAVLTSSMEEHAQGPLLSELADILPEAHAGRIKRLGIVNAMDDENFAAAVKATGRKKLIIAGVTNDVCPYIQRLLWYVKATRFKWLPMVAPLLPPWRTTLPFGAWIRAASR